MYSLKELEYMVFGEQPEEDWDGKLYCLETDAASTIRTNETNGFMMGFSYTIVLQGSLTLRYNGQEMSFQQNDLYIYSPGLQVIILTVSEDYRGICLIADEHLTFETPNVHDMIRIAYLPIVQLYQPRISLNNDAANTLTGRMREIIACLHSNHLYKAEVLRMLYALFLLDLNNSQNLALNNQRIPKRQAEIFINFIQLLPDHFTERHDIGFYADQLNISTVYLSRVVRQVTGRTVIDYINQMLLMEASFLLSTSALSITQIAERLHFADTPSFSKFFLRMKGQSPRDYREKQ